MARNAMTFESALKTWIKVTTKSKELARYLAEASLRHFSEHGDTSKCQIFLEAIEAHGKNYVRKAAYLKWLQAHSPIDMREGRLCKKEGGQFDPVLVEKAMNTPFWDFAPDPEMVAFGYDDVVKAINAAVKRFEGEHYKPKDDAALARLHKAKELAAALAA